MIAGDGVKGPRENGPFGWPRIIKGRPLQQAFFDQLTAMTMSCIGLSILCCGFYRLY